MLYSHCMRRGVSNPAFSAIFEHDQYKREGNRIDGQLP